MHTLILLYIAGEDKVIATNLIGQINTLSLLILVVLGTGSVVQHGILHSIVIGIMMIQSQNRCTTARIASNGECVSMIRGDHDQRVLNVGYVACQGNCLLKLQGFVQRIARFGIMVTIVDKATWR